jgi:hypothetical protein
LPKKRIKTADRKRHKTLAEMKLIKRLFDDLLRQSVTRFPRKGEKLDAPETFHEVYIIRNGKNA